MMYCCNLNPAWRKASRLFTKAYLPCCGDCRNCPVIDGCHVCLCQPCQHGACDRRNTHTLRLRPRQQQLQQLGHTLRTQAHRADNADMQSILAGGRLQHLRWLWAAQPEATPLPTRFHPSLLRRQNIQAKKHANPFQLPRLCLFLFPCITFACPCLCPSPPSCMCHACHEDCSTCLCPPASPFQNQPAKWTCAPG